MANKNKRKLKIQEKEDGAEHGELQTTQKNIDVFFGRARHCSAIEQPPNVQGKARGSPERFVTQQEWQSPPPAPISARSSPAAGTRTGGKVVFFKGSHAAEFIQEVERSQRGRP